MTSLGTSGTAYVIKPLLDDIFINKDAAMLQILPLIIILLYAAKSIGHFIEVYYISYVGGDIIKRIRNKLLKHILDLDLTFFYEKHSGDLISRLTNDINRLQNAVSTQIAILVREFFTIIALLFIVIYQSPELAFYGLVVMPLAILPLSILAKKMKKISFLSQEKNSDITQQLNESFQNIEIIKANSTEQIECSKFKAHNQKFFSIFMKAVKANEMVTPVMEMLGALAVAIVITVGGQYVIDDKLTIGEFFSFLTALFMLYTPIKRISSVYNQLQDALAANERINDIFQIKANIISGNKKINADINTIKFSNYNLSFGDSFSLKNINLEIKKGETVAFVGNSGSGKSTVVNTLVRFYDPISGNISFDDKNIQDFSLNSLRQSISIVTQRVYIFNDTIAQNIAYGFEINEQKVIECLKLAHAYDFVEKMPEGINTILKESGTNLSGGQRQRISIARALYKNPKILILDEATSALDNKSESIITEVLDDISKNRITIIIAHRLNTIKNASHVVVFKNGEIVSQGTRKYVEEHSEDFAELNNLITKDSID